jgi:hypothetical protein
MTAARHPMDVSTSDECQHTGWGLASIRIGEAPDGMSTAKCVSPLVAS